MSLLVRLVMPSCFTGYLGYAAYQFGKNTIYKRRKELELYGENGNPAKISDEMENIEDEIKIKLDWDVKILANIELFMTRGMDITHKGMTYMKTGTIIGIPRTFDFKHPKDVDCWNEICQWYNIHVHRRSETGERLVNSLILSNKAKKFAVAREIFLADSYELHCHLMFLLIPLFVSYTLFYYTEMKFKPVIRIPMYILTGMFMLKLYWDMTDNYNRYLENSVDAEAAKMGEDYAEGGLEFYDKLIEKNKLLDSIHGDSELSRFDKFLKTFRKTHLPLEHRRNNISQYLKMMKEQPSQDNEFQDV